MFKLAKIQIRPLRLCIVIIFPILAVMRRDTGADIYEDL